MSQNHRMVGIGRDLWGSSCPTPLPKQGHLQQAAQDLVQSGLEYLQRRRLHHLPGQPVPVLPKLGGVAEAPDAFAAIQRDHDRLEKWADRNLNVLSAGVHVLVLGELRITQTEQKSFWARGGCDGKKIPSCKKRHTVADWLWYSWTDVKLFYRCTETILPFLLGDSPIEVQCFSKSRRFQQHRNRS